MGEIRAAKWHILGVCSACRLKLWIDLDQLIVTAGAETLLWGRTGRCRAWKWGDDERCEGRVVFQARSIRSGSWTRLAFTEEVRTLWWQRLHPGQDPEQMAFDAARRSNR